MNVNNEKKLKGRRKMLDWNISRMSLCMMIDFVFSCDRLGRHKLPSWFNADFTDPMVRWDYGGHTRMAWLDTIALLGIDFKVTDMHDMKRFIKEYVF